LKKEEMGYKDFEERMTDFVEGPKREKERKE